jgi:hypothetical protein
MHQQYSRKFAMLALKNYCMLDVARFVVLLVKSSAIQFFGPYHLFCFIQMFPLLLFVGAFLHPSDMRRVNSREACYGFLGTFMCYLTIQLLQTISSFSKDCRDDEADFLSDTEVHLAI